MTINDIMEYFPEYSGKDLIVSGYNTLNKINDVQSRHFCGALFSLFSYCGELTYVESDGFGDINLVDGQIQYSLGVTNFGKTRASNWIITIYENSMYENNGQVIEGVLCSLFGKDFLSKKVFSQEYRDRKSSFATQTILNPYYRIAKDLHENDYKNISIFDQKFQKLGETDKQSIARSLTWLSESTKSYGSESFLRMWIALEIAFTKTENTVKELRIKIARANDIENEKVDFYFHIGKIYGIRKEIVHRGKNPPIDGSILDILFYLYTDLLFYKITGQKDKRAIDYIVNKQIDFDKLLNRCFA